jgi:rhomboid protease GluP
VTLVTTLAYLTLLVVTQPFGAPEEFAERLASHGWLTGAAVANGEPWRLLSYAFLHGGIVHVGFNLMMLWGLCPALERSLGSLRFAGLYVVAAAGGGLATCLCYPPGQPVVGGSGALFGMLGAAIAINMRSGRHLLAFLDFEGPRRLLGMLVANLVIGFVLPMVSNTAHLGGLLAGFVVTFWWLRPGEATRQARLWQLAWSTLFAAACFASLLPVARSDWLAHAALRATDPARQDALTRAALRAHELETR